MTINTITETIYEDGSGTSGLYEIYGQQFSGITTGRGGKITVTALGIRSSYRSAKERGCVRSGSKALERYLSQFV